MLSLYGLGVSGNCYKIQLLLAQLERPYHWIETDTRKGESRTPQFLAKNPNGKVPLLELENGETLPESNAILYYLARDTRYFPTDLVEQAHTLEWMFFEQYSHEPYLAVNRWWIKFLGRDSEPQWQAQLAENQKRGYAALDVMEGHLQKHDFFAANRYTIADIALYAYTHVAADGHFNLGRYPAVRAWLERVAAQPGHVKMAGE